MDIAAVIQPLLCASSVEEIPPSTGLRRIFKLVPQIIVVAVLRSDKPKRTEFPASTVRGRSKERFQFVRNEKLLNK
jgi:hypothetical protein